MEHVEKKLSGTILFLDDVRDPSSSLWQERFVYMFGGLYDVVWCKTPDELEEAFEAVLSRGELPAAIFFDNDLGPGVKCGSAVFTWVEEQVRTRNIGPFLLFCHSANPAAKREILGGIEALRRYWREQGAP